MQQLAPRPHLFDPRFVGRNVPCNRQNGKRWQRDIRCCKRWKRQVIDGVVDVNNFGKCSEAVDNSLKQDTQFNIGRDCWGATDTTAEEPADQQTVEGSCKCTHIKVNAMASTDVTNFNANAQACSSLYCTHHISDRRTLCECHSQNVLGGRMESIFTARES